MDPLLYTTIWIALGLFAAGHVGRGSAQPDASTRGWWLYAAGFVIAVIHILIAMGLRHGWSHASAVVATAQQTNAVFGVDWGGGVWVNYVFMAAWLMELIAWRVRPARHLAWSGWTLWLVRAFYFIVLTNAAVVFAFGWRRALGLVLVIALVRSWRSGDRSHVGM